MEHKEFTDQELLKGLADNNHSAIRFVYKNYFKLVKTMVLSNSGDEDDAQDIFQETLVVLYHKAKEKGFELDCQLKTYIYSVARNQWLKQLRNKTGKKVYELNDETEGTADVEQDIDLFKQKELDYEKMAICLQKLGEPCKSIIEAYYIHEKNMPQIAEQFGYTNTDNAKNQKYKCLVRLKKLFFSHK